MEFRHRRLTRRSTNCPRRRHRRLQPTEADGWIDLVGSDFRGLDLRLLDAARKSTSAMRLFRRRRPGGVGSARGAPGGRQPGPCADIRYVFPVAPGSDEIRMSLKFGTRLRYLPEP